MAGDPPQFNPFYPFGCDFMTFADRFRIPTPIEEARESLVYVATQMRVNLNAVRTIADEAQRSGDPIAMGNALLRIRRIIDGVEE